MKDTARNESELDSGEEKHIEKEGGQEGDLGVSRQSSHQEVVEASLLLCPSAKK